MKVLFLCQRVPYPPDRGDRITTHHFLQHMLNSGASVRVGCLAEENRDLEASSELAQRVTDICVPRIRRAQNRLGSLRGLFSGEPLSLPFFRNRELMARVQEWLREDPPELVYVYSSSMAQYVAKHRSCPRVMQFAELDSDKWRQYARRSGPVTRWIYNRESRLLLEFERRIALDFDVSFVVSPAEKILFTEHIPDVEPIVLPNGVDVDRFRSAGEGQRKPHTAIFTGVMDYPPNVDGVLWFARTCWPAIRARFPDARFLVVGSRPNRAVRALDGQHGIYVTGRVPETQPWFDCAAVAVAPLRVARGLQNKVLEAMSMGLPVVATPAAIGGLPTHGFEILVSATEGDTIAAVCRLMESPGLARQLGKGAAALVRQHYRWEDKFVIFDRAIRTVMKSFVPSAPPNDADP